MIDICKICGIALATVVAGIIIIPLIAKVANLWVDFLF